MNLSGVLYIISRVQEIEATVQDVETKGEPVNLTAFSY